MIGPAEAAPPGAPSASSPRKPGGTMQGTSPARRRSQRAARGSTKPSFA